MAKEKKELNPQQFNEFLIEVATKVEPRTIGDIFSGKAVKEVYEDLTDDNPLIKSYKLTGTGFINKILRDKTDFKFSDEDKKLLLEVGAFGGYDPKSGFKLNDKDPKVAKLIEENAKKLAEARPNMSDAEYENYRANLRKDLVADVLKTNVTQLVFDDTAPKLDASERDRTKPFSDFITKELQMQSGLGFEPDVPAFAGGLESYKYSPAEDQERFRTRTITSEALDPTIQKRDRLDSFSAPDETSGLMQGPDGAFYNPKTNEFLRREPVYGTPPVLQGYQYDPRLGGILSEAVNPDYGSQFKAGGKTMDIREQTKNVAAQGRYGDSMLLHVNPAEVKGLAQAMPITINPQTGQPEAFLPFLAPVLGSLAGSTLLAGTGGLLAGKTLLASAIGSGLAQYAVTGDLKKGLLAGLTGYGIGSALQGAGAAAKAGEAATAAESAITEAATDAATQAALTDPNLVNTALQGPALEGAAGVGLNQAGQDFVNIKTAEALAGSPSTIAQAGRSGFGDAIGSQAYLQSNPTLGQAFSDAGGFSIEGGKNILTGLSQPGAYIPAGVGMGTTSVLESQELFEDMLERNAREREEERQRIIAENPEMIPIATGGVTSFQEGGDTDIDITKLPGYNPADASRYRRAGSFDDYTKSLIGDQMNFVQDAADFYSVSPSDYYQGMDGNLYSNNRFPPNVGSYTGTGYVRKREATPIDPNFMPGFQPEAMYFDNLNPSATAITGGRDRQQGGVVRGGPAQTRFDPTKTAGYQSFYGEAARDIIPQVVDPYAPVQFEQPQALIAPPGIGRPRIPVQPIDNPRVSDDIPEIDFDIDFGNLPPIDNLPIGDPTPKATATPQTPDESVISKFVREDIPVLDSSVDTKGLTLLDQLKNKLDTGREDLTDNIAATRDIDRRSVGQQTDIEVDKLPEGLKKMYESGPKGREGVAKIAAKTDKFQEGGATEIMQDPLTVQLLQFLRGEIQDDTIVGRFVDKYGNEAFLQIREQVLQEIVPGAETTGQIVNGNDAGGMADNVYGKIGATQGVAMSQDEYVIPADVMSMLGDGSSDAGAKKLDQMLDRVRKDKTGTTKQAAPIDERKVMPA